MTTTNGAHTATPDQLARLENLVANVWQGRQDLYRRFLDPRSDIDEECRYPDALSAQFYRTLYDRTGIAERVVQLMPKETWQVTPQVYEDESAKKATPFEAAWDELGQQLRGGKGWHQDEKGSLIWTYLYRADILSGIGTFGVVLLGIDDGRLLQEPADGVDPDGTPKDVTGISQTKDIYGGDVPRPQQLASTLGTDAQYFQTQLSPMQTGKKLKSGPRKLLFLRCFDESLVQVVQYEASMYSPRFGQPVMYQITLNDPRQPHTGIGLPLATVRVHWSRVVHLAENDGVTSEIFAKPRLRPVTNNILDVRKLYGGSAEMYWRGAFPGLSIETHPQMGGDVIVDPQKLRDMMTDYHQHLQRWISLMGMSAKSLAPQVVDPTPQIAVQIEAICIELGCPVRVFKGSERGELASSQDDDSWNDRLLHRQQMYLTPKVIAPFIDRLITLKVLPEPEGYSIEWPSLDSIGKTAKASIALQETQAITAYVGGNGEQLLTPQTYLTKVLNWTEEEAEAAIDDAEKAVEEKQQEAADLADEHGMIPTPPEGFQQKPEPPPPMPPAVPIKIKPGEKLVHPASVQPPGGAKPPAPAPAANVENANPEGVNQYTYGDAVRVKLDATIKKDGQEIPHPRAGHAGSVMAHDVKAGTAVMRLDFDGGKQIRVKASDLEKHDARPKGEDSSRVSHRSLEQDVHREFAKIKVSGDAGEAKQFLDDVVSKKGASYLHGIASDHGVPTGVNPGGKGLDTANPGVIRDRIIAKHFPTTNEDYSGNELASTLNADDPEWEDYFAANAWDEDLHPRGPDGKFLTGSARVAKVTEIKTAKGEVYPKAKAAKAAGKAPAKPKLEKITKVLAPTVDQMHEHITALRASGDVKLADTTAVLAKMATMKVADIKELGKRLEVSAGSGAKSKLSQTLLSRAMAKPPAEPAKDPEAKGLPPVAERLKMIQDKERDGVPFTDVLHQKLEANGAIPKGLPAHMLYQDLRRQAAGLAPLNTSVKSEQLGKALKEIGPDMGRLTAHEFMQIVPHVPYPSGGSDLSLVTRQKKLPDDALEKSGLSAPAAKSAPAKQEATTYGVKPPEGLEKPSGTMAPTRERLAPLNQRLDAIVKREGYGKAPYADSLISALQVRDKGLQGSSAPAVFKDLQRHLAGEPTRDVTIHPEHLQDALRAIGQDSGRLTMGELSRVIPHMKYPEQTKAGVAGREVIQQRNVPEDIGAKLGLKPAKQRERTAVAANPPAEVAPAAKLVPVKTEPITAPKTEPTPTPKVETANPDVPKGYSAGKTDAETGVAVATNANGDRHTMNPASKEQFEKLAPAIASGIDRAKMFQESKEGLIPLPILVGQIQRVAPDAKLGDVYSALKHVWGEGAVQLHQLNEVRELGGANNDVRLAPGAKDRESGTLWQNGRAMHFVAAISKNGKPMSGDDVVEHARGKPVAEQPKSTPTPPAPSIDPRMASLVHETVKQLAGDKNIPVSLSTLKTHLGMSNDDLHAAVNHLRRAGKVTGNTKDRDLKSSEIKAAINEPGGTPIHQVSIRQD